ncbi:MAG: SsrA-binding protein SmpB [Deferribacteraceae bacterium]|jgi:SsrA-binding protein|nr:SsrA-binding protein SmpB [Deferribacteraceae bacterium]
MALSSNKKAFHDFEILEEFEAGIILTGTEVKSVRVGHISLKEAYIKVWNGEAFLVHAHIAEYEGGNINNHDPLRIRKLLLHKRQLKYLSVKITEQGLAAVPLKVYIKNRHIKISIAVAKGKKLYDKRHSEREREMKRTAERALRNSVKSSR